MTIMGLWGQTHEQAYVAGGGWTLRFIVEDHGYNGHGPTGGVVWHVDVATPYGWSNVARRGPYSRSRLDGAIQHGREAFAAACERFGVATTDEEPDREASADQERAWDEQYDGTSMGA